MITAPSIRDTAALCLNPYGRYLHRESRVLVMGLPQYGKTRIVRDALTAECPKVVFHDITRHDYYVRGRLPIYKHELAARPHLLQGDFVRLVVIAASTDAAEVAAEREELWNLICDATASDPLQRPIILVEDEIGRDERKSEGTINDMFARATHHNVVPIVMAQKATDIPLGARTMASQVICFAQYHDKELTAIRDTYGDLFAASVAGIKKGDAPAIWDDRYRERYWSDNARRKFAVRTG